MIALDTNVLVYAHRAESVFHERAFECVKGLAEGSRPWGIPVSCLHEFLSIVTHPKIFRPASSYEQALDQVDAWLASPVAHILHSNAQHWRILSDLTRKAKTACLSCTALIATLDASKPSRRPIRCLIECHIYTTAAADNQ
jgi:predicted nucleic acid-binding protein